MVLLSAECPNRVAGRCSPPFTLSQTKAPQGNLVKNNTTDTRIIVNYFHSVKQKHHALAKNWNL
jgi:hypothetical protein